MLPVPSEGQARAKIWDLDDERPPDWKKLDPTTANLTATNLKAKDGEELRTGLEDDKSYGGVRKRLPKSNNESNTPQDSSSAPRQPKINRNRKVSNNDGHRAQLRRISSDGGQRFVSRIKGSLLVRNLLMEENLRQSREPSPAQKAIQTGENDKSSPTKSSPKRLTHIKLAREEEPMLESPPVSPRSNEVDFTRLQQWDVQEVANWIGKLGFNRWREKFIMKRLDGQKLLEVKSGHYFRKELNLPPGDAVQIFSALREI